MTRLFPFALFAALLMALSAPALAEVVNPDEDAHEHDSRSHGLANLSFSGVDARLVSIGANLNVSLGASSERDEHLQELQAGGHDPNSRGFNFQSLELVAQGAIDDWLLAKIHVLTFVDNQSGETFFELEEASALAPNLGHGFELEVGHMLTEFGRHNPSHPHDWVFMDQPVVTTRMFGADSMRSLGARVAWRPIKDRNLKIHAGVQNARGETMASFLGGFTHSHGEEEEEHEHEEEEGHEEEGPGLLGRPFVSRATSSINDFVWLGRVTYGDSLEGGVNYSLGASVLYGPNATGDEGDTLIYGFDLAAEYLLESGHEGHDHDHHCHDLARMFRFRLEWIGRSYFADRYVNPEDGDELASETFDDWGVYAYGLYDVTPRWSAGLRLGYAEGNDDANPLQDTRVRVSPLVQWRVSDWSRVRLQYNYDDADHLESGDAHSVYLGIEITLGEVHHHHE